MNKKAMDHIRADLAMARLMDRIGPFRLRPRHVPIFESLTHAIIHQQLNGHAAATILARFQKLFSDNAFPTPEEVLRVPLNHLATAGLSRAKAGYILDIAQRAVSGELLSLKKCHGMIDADLIDQLTKVKGIGRWTAEMLLIFNLGRPDVLPVNDLGIRRGFQVVYAKRKLPEPEQVGRFGARWAPYRTTAAWYLWRAADFLKSGQW
jgi:3-methyladenine DNA glycosylase/8-oxoguanine DNA glycosylase